MLFSVFATLKLHGVNPRQWLTKYLEACAAAGGKVPGRAEDFLPWNMSEEVKAVMRMFTFKCHSGQVHVFDQRFPVKAMPIRRKMDQTPFGTDRTWPL